MLREANQKRNGGGASEVPPRVLVVTPSLNQAQFLRWTIDSVLGQDYPQMDYFVADGGSTDGSVEILRSYGDRVRWASAADDGQSAAIADAWAGTDAEIVAWLNSDDTYLPGAVSRAVAHLGAHPSAGMVYGAAWFVDEQGEKLEAYPTRAFDDRRLRSECFICQPATFVRRAVFERIDLPDRALRYCMDYDLWIRLSREFEVAFLDEFLACSRRHAETKSQRELSQVFAEIAQMTTSNYGVTPRNWAVAQMIHDCKLWVGRCFGFLPRRLRERLQAALVSRREARYVGALYSDGWAGTATLVEVQPDDQGRVRLRGESPHWPFAGALAITVELGSETLARHAVAGRGAFEVGFALPRRLQKSVEPVEVLLRASGTFVPQVAGCAPWDERPVSFIVR